MKNTVKHIALFALVFAHVSCPAVDQRVQEAGVTLMNGNPCFSVDFPKASTLELAGLEVNEQAARGVRAVWEVSFPNEKNGGKYLRSVQCLQYGLRYPNALEIMPPSELIPGRRYGVDIQVFAWTAAAQEQRAYNFKANFCVKRNGVKLDVLQVPWVEEEDIWDWSICDQKK